MSDTEINIAIAQACNVKPTLAGWVVKHPTEDRIILGVEFKCDAQKWLDELPSSSYAKNWIITEQLRYLNYCTDLNAMWKAEETLTAEEQDRYEDAVLGYYDQDRSGRGELWIAAHATARQRAEAFLRTKGLWKE